MKKDSKKLAFIALVAFICFLITFADAFYLYGVYREIGVLVFAFTFPIYYLILTVVTLVMMHGVIITKRPYIVMSILIAAFILLMWIIYLCITLIGNENNGAIFYRELWLPIVLTVLSLIMSICYISLIVDIINVDKKIKLETQNSDKKSN